MNGKSGLRLLALLLILVLAACTSSGEPAAGGEDTGTPPAGGETVADPLDGSSWYLHQYGDATTPTDLPPTVEVTLAFADGRAGGLAACNNYSGEYSVDGGSLTVGPIAMTEMACLEQEKMIIESLYGRSLQEAQSFVLDGDTLRISYPDGVLVFRTTPPASGADALDGTGWFLTAYGPADAPQSVPGGIEATANFANGAISGSAGCNSYSGSYTLEGDSFSTGMLAMTMMACEDAVNTFEIAFAGLLQTAESSALDGEFLTLSGPDGVLIFSQSPAAPTYTLEGTRWLLNGLQTGNAVSSPVAGSDAFITFDGERVAGSTGCNSFNGSYALTDGVLSIGPLATTRMACAEGLGLQEQQILEKLAEELQVSVDGDQLQLLSGGEALLFRADPAGMPAEGPVYVRVVNGTGRQLTGIEVNFEFQQEGYGDLAPGETSDYRPVGRAYRYAYVALQADGDPYVLQPIDYVGETPLAAGYHTYVLTLANDQVAIEYLSDGPEPAPAPDLNPDSALPDWLPGDLDGQVNSGGGIALGYVDGDSCVVVALSESLPDQVGVGPCRSQFGIYDLPAGYEFAAMDLTDLLNTYVAFGVETAQGYIAFGGRGSAEPTPAVQRMIATWVRTQAAAGQGTLERDPLALRWSIEGGIAGFCETLLVTDYGLVEHYEGCGADPLGELLGRRFLTADELAPFYALLDGAAPAAFSVGNLDDPNVADGMGETFLFEGRGARAAGRGRAAGVGGRRLGRQPLIRSTFREYKRPSVGDGRIFSGGVH